MGSETRFLVDLQRADAKLASLTDAEHSLQSELEERCDALRSLEEECAKAHQHLKMVRKEKMELELALDEAEGLIKRHDEEKYRVKSQQEFDALEKEIKALQAKKDGYEDQLLERMEEEERLDVSLPSLEEKLQADQAAWTAEQRRFAQESEKIRQQKEDITRQREYLSTQISQSYYNQYQKLRRAQGGLAVVPVEEGVCAGCNMAVSSSLISQLRHEEFVQCENCGRILYIAGENAENEAL